MQCFSFKLKVERLNCAKYSLFNSFFPVLKMENESVTFNLKAHYYILGKYPFLFNRLFIVFC